MATLPDSDEVGNVLVPQDLEWAVATRISQHGRMKTCCRVGRLCCDHRSVRL